MDESKSPSHSLNFSTVKLWLYPLGNSYEEGGRLELFLSLQEGVRGEGTSKIVESEGVCLLYPPIRPWKFNKPYAPLRIHQD